MSDLPTLPDILADLGHRGALAPDAYRVVTSRRPLPSRRPPIRLFDDDPRRPSRVEVAVTLLLLAPPLSVILYWLLTPGPWTVQP